MTNSETHVPVESDRLEPPIEDRSAQLHPMLGSLIGERTVELSTEQIDNPEGVLTLERYSRAFGFIKDWYARPGLTPLERALAPLYSPMHSVTSIGNQFATKIVPCYMEQDVEIAHDNFREIVPNTIDEEMVLLTNEEQFKELHTSLREHLEASDADMQEAVQLNLIEMAKADKMQFSGSRTRSLERMRAAGMVITIDQSSTEQIHQAHELAGEGILPLTEYVKNGRILAVSGFNGSKISLAVHDFMDHIWTFDMIDRAGLLDRYSSMFDSVGNPEATDIFKREGEMVASIAFGVRLFQTTPSAFGPLMRSSMIEEHLDGLFVAGQLEERHMEAYRTIKSLRKGSMEWQSLGFTFSNYQTELDEQRRKFGRIKQQDPRTRQITGELDPLSPDYLSFFIDTHHQLLSSKHKHRDDLFRFHILLEEYLAAFASGTIPREQPLNFRLNELRDIDFTKTTLPPQRIMWMRNNYGFTATRAAIV